MLSAHQLRRIRIDAVVYVLTQSHYCAAPTNDQEATSATMIPRTSRILSTTVERRKQSSSNGNTRSLRFGTSREREVCRTGCDLVCYQSNVTNLIIVIVDFQPIEVEVGALTLSENCLVVNIQYNLNRFSHAILANAWPKLRSDSNPVIHTHKQPRLPSLHNASRNQNVGLPTSTALQTASGLWKRCLTKSMCRSYS